MQTSVSYEAANRKGRASSELLLQDLKKRSYLKLPVEVDVARLLEEYHRIPESAWGVSHWDVHSSIDVLQLRGGHKGTAEDYVTDSVTNNPILKDFPYIAWLLGPEGPLGGASYAVIFRMKPFGISRVHYDSHEAWQRTIRVHIPIQTNDDAFLLTDGRAKHFDVGEVWVFDNGAAHSAINGATERVHMIIDVDPNAKLSDLLRKAKYDPGVYDAERWAKTDGPEHGGRIPPFSLADGEPLFKQEKLALGLKEDGFATRITKIGKKSAFLGVPLQVGDVVTAVDGVDSSLLSRTALDHIVLKHEPGQTVTLDILRGGKPAKVQVNLKPYYFFSPYLRALHMLRGLGFNIKPGKEVY